MFDKKVSIVTPSYENHAIQYLNFLKSAKNNCCDLNDAIFVVVVEKKNKDLFLSFFKEVNIPHYQVVLTEDILNDFSSKEDVSTFLRRVGKFTFQTVKKLGAFKYLKTEWALILDSESIFIKDFSIREMFDNYKERKYIFYTQTEKRGSVWKNSLAHQVNKNVSDALKIDATSRWYMEYFHWFYETSKVKEMLSYNKKNLFFSYIKNIKIDYSRYRYEGKTVDFFENILYYNFIYKYYEDEYAFIDIEKELRCTVSNNISKRFKLNELPFSLFGNEYIMNIISNKEVEGIVPFFDKYKLPFIRLEPPFFNGGYLKDLEKIPSLNAIISSHHSIWLKKKIAVCVSGEFRHIIHRVPEQQIRMLKSFLSGVDCDIFIHGWRSTSEALILNELNPKEYLFEDRKDFSALEKKIKFKEPNIKQGRDNGSLSMFYSLQKSFEILKAHQENYDFVVRIRPDVFPDVSLKEILINITDVGDFVDNSIYFPKNYHSKGINDQIAIGPIECMEKYFHTFDFICSNVSSLLFNPEFILLKNILRNSIKPVVTNIPYALMRELPMKISNISRVLDEQENVWWSRTDNLPCSQDLTKIFIEKMFSMENILIGKIPSYFFIFISKEKNKEAWLEVINDDNNPSFVVNCLIINKKNVNIYPYESKNLKCSQYKNFIFKYRDTYILSQWGMSEHNMTNEQIHFEEKDLYLEAPCSKKQIIKGWEKYDKGQKISFFMKEENPFLVKAIMRILILITKGKKKRKLIEETDQFLMDSKFMILRYIGRKYF